MFGVGDDDDDDDDADDDDDDDDAGGAGGYDDLTTILFTTKTEETPFWQNQMHFLTWTWRPWLKKESNAYQGKVKQPIPSDSSTVIIGPNEQKRSMI